MSGIYHTLPLTAGDPAPIVSGAPIRVVDSDGNVVGVILDGAIYRLQAQATITGTVPLPTGAATEATLSALNVNAADIETILTAIRDTAGVKKITDALPSGTNTIGKVDQGVAAALTGGWPVRLVDGSGNAVGLILDGSIYRIQTESKIVGTLPLPSGAATEATLSALNTNAADIETILTAIRDTAGIKKITDALPAGTNTIGKVDQGTAGALSNGWPSRLVDGSGNAVTITLDGGLYKLETKSTISGAGIATETTLAAILVDTGQIETILTAIKDTAGIKKITDALPTGSNTIGKVDQGTAGALTNGWPSRLVDGSGNAVGITLDGGIYKLETKSTLSGAGIATETTLAAILVDTGQIEVILAAIRDTAGIKKITDALPTGDNVIGRVKITEGTNVAGLILDGAIYRLQVETKQAAGSVVNTRIQDGNGTILADVSTDPIDAFNRLAVEGKVSISNPMAPAGTTAVQYAPSPLGFMGVDTDTFVITDGKTLTIQSIFAGAEGDPTEKGSKVEVFYTPDGGATEKIIDRIYITGDTISLFPDVKKSRDGTSLLGIAVNQGKIIIRRTHFGGVSKEFDVVVRGFEQ